MKEINDKQTKIELALLRSLQRQGLITAQELAKSESEILKIENNTKIA